MRAGIVEREDPGVEGGMSLLHAHFLHPQIYFGKQRIPMKFKSRFHKYKGMKGGRTWGYVCRMKFWN